MSTTENSKSASVTDLLDTISKIVDIEKRLRTGVVTGKEATEQLDKLAAEVTERWPDTFNDKFRAEYFGAAKKVVGEKQAAPDSISSAKSALEQLADTLRPRACEVSEQLRRPSHECRSVADAESLLRKKLAASRNPITAGAKRRISVFVAIDSEQPDLFPGTESEYSGTTQLLVADAYGNVHDVGALFAVVTGDAPLSTLDGLSNTTRLRIILRTRAGAKRDELAVAFIAHLRGAVLDEALAKLYPGEPAEATAVVAVTQ